MPVFDLVPDRSTRLGFSIFLSHVILYIIKRLKKFDSRYNYQIHVTLYLPTPLIILVFMLIRTFHQTIYEEYMKLCAYLQSHKHQWYKKLCGWLLKFYNWILLNLKDPLVNIQNLSINFSDFTNFLGRYKILYLKPTNR